MQRPEVGSRAEHVALLFGTLATVLIVMYAVSVPELLHVNVTVTPGMIVAAVAALAVSILIVRRGDMALAVLVGVAYLNLSHVLVRQGLPSLLQLVAVPLLLAALISRPAADWQRLVRQPLTWLLTGYTLLLLASTVYARAPHLADARVGVAARALLIYLLIVLLASSVRRVRIAAWTMVLAGALLALLGILRTVGIAVPGLSAGLARVELAHIHGAVFEPRVTGPLGDANFFAQILLVLVPIGMCLAREAKVRWRRLAGYACVGLIVTATVLTYSRGGALALAFVLVAALLAHGVSMRRLALGGTALALAAVVALPAEFTARLATIRQLLPGGQPVLHLDSSFEERLLLTGTAWQMFLDNPLLGVGAGNYTEHFEEYAARVGSAAPDYHEEGAPRYAHSLLLEVGAETGMPGLLMFAGVLGAAFLALARVRTVPSTDDAFGVRGLALALQISIAGYLVSSLFLHGDFQRYLWLLFGMAGAIDALVVPRRSVHRTGGGTPVGPRAEPGVEEPATSPSAPATRRGIAVLLSRFPSVTETFILREVIEMERQGQPVRLLPLLRESPSIVHREAEPWIDRAWFTPFVSPAIITANLRALVRRPWRYVSLVTRLVGGTLHSPRVCLATIAFIPKAVWLAERVRAEGIRHVHAHFATHPTTVALVIAELADASFSFTIHAHDLFSRRYRPLLRFKLERAAFVRVISRYNVEHLRRLYPRASLDRVHVIHVGIEPELYGDAAETGAVVDEPRDASGAQSIRLVSVAALRDYKGIPVLIEACRRLRDEGLAVQCEIVGEGPMRLVLEQHIRTLGLETCVRLVGARPQHEVRRLLAERPIFVLSSIVLADGWMEGIPVALMEAMASGAAVVTSRISGIPELVEDRVSGMLVEPGDVEALVRAIREVASAPELARRLGEAGRRKVYQRFRLDHTVSELLARIDEQNAPVSIPVAAAAARIGAWNDHSPVGVRWTSEGSDATVSELLVPNADGPVQRCILKVHRDRSGASRPAAARALNEWHVLESIQSQWRSNGPSSPVSGRRLAVPRPVGGTPDDGWLVMEACEGPSLASLLRAARFHRDGQWSHVTAAVRDAGAWLREVQALGPIDGEPDAAFAAWELAVEEDLRRCSGIVPERLLRDASARLSELVSRGACGSSAGVLHHGDFWPGNVFVAADRLNVIDFEGARAGLPWEDVAYFLIQLELFLEYPLLEARRRAATAAFLDGYLRGDALDEPALRAAWISKSLQVVARSSVRDRWSIAARRRRFALTRMLAEASS